MRVHRLVVFLCLLVVALLAGSACQPEPLSLPTPIHVSATPGRDLALELPIPSREPATPLPGATPTPQPTESEPAAVQPEISYRLDAELDWLARTVAVDQQVELRNTTGVPLREVVFALDMNGSEETFRLKRVLTGAGLRLDNYTIDGTQLTVRLPQPLLPGGLLSLQLVFDLAIPQIRAGYRYGHMGYFGYSDRQVNLGNWFPLVAYYHPIRGWICPQPHTIGEQSVRPVADFDVTLRVTGAPEGLKAAAPGRVTEEVDGWRFVLPRAREFTVSVSDRFEILSTSTASGAVVELYYFPDSDRGLAAPRHALVTAAQALALFEQRFALPYVHGRLIVVEGDFPDGMEFSGLVFVSGDWFRAWLGIPNDWLTLITAHEVSHQWWYSAVGNDQGTDPYLDEALAIYSELLFFERYYPEHVNWWWNFRVGAYSPSGFVDASVYDFHSPRPYINAVYLQGARMLQALRDDLGDAAFFAWLQRYAAQMHGQVATPDDFWGALSSDEYAATFETRARFLRNVNVLARSADLP